MNGRKLSHIVDTQIAAIFLGYQDCLSLQNLIRKVLNVDIAKDETISDWTQRPLSNNQLYYASNDVFYLIKLYEQLSHILKKESKWEFFTEECQNLSEIKNPIETQSLKYLKRNDSDYVKAMIKKLVHWREEKAKLKNLPRNWILKDRYLRTIALEKNNEEWLNKQLLTEKQFNSYQHIFCGFQRDLKHLSNSRTIAKNYPSIEKTIIKIKQKVLKCSQKWNIPNEFICNQKTIKSIVEDAILIKNLKKLNGWRGRLLNDSFYSVLKKYLVET